MRVTGLCMLMGLLVICFVAGLQAADKRDVEDLLRFFPDYQYGYLTHINYEEMKQAPTYELMDRREDRYREIGVIHEDTSPFAVRLGEERLSLTSATAITYKKIRRKVEKPTDDAAAKELEEKLRSEFQRMRSFYLETEGEGDDAESFVVLSVENSEIVMVYQLALGQLFCEWAVKESYFIDTGEALFKRPIWKYAASGKGHDYSRYYYLELTGELLCSDSLDCLKDMVLAGAGQKSTFLDSEFCSELLQIMPELGQQWSVTNQEIYRLPEDEDILNKRGLDERQIARYKESRKHWPLWYLQSVKLDSRITSITIEAYLSEEYAKIGLKDHNIGIDYSRSSFPAAMVKVLTDNDKLIRENTVNEQYDRYIISRFVQTPEIYKAMLTTAKEYKKLMEQQQKEQAEKKKEEK